MPHTRRNNEQQDRYERETDDDEGPRREVARIADGHAEHAEDEAEKPPEDESLADGREEERAHNGGHDEVRENLENTRYADGRGNDNAEQRIEEEIPEG